MSSRVLLCARRRKKAREVNMHSGARSRVITHEALTLGAKFKTVQKTGVIKINNLMQFATLMQVLKYNAKISTMDRTSKSLVKRRWLCSLL